MRLTPEAVEKIVADAEADGTMPPEGCFGCWFQIQKGEVARHAKCEAKWNARRTFFVARALELGYDGVALSNPTPWIGEKERRSGFSFFDADPTGWKVFYGDLYLGIIFRKEPNVWGLKFATGLSAGRTILHVAFSRLEAAGYLHEISNRKK